MKRTSIRKILSLALTVAVVASLFVLPAAQAAGGSVTTTFTTANGLMNGMYVGANGTTLNAVERPTAITGTAAIDGKYDLNGVLNNSKLIKTALAGAATAGTTKVEVTIQNLSTKQYLSISGTNGADSTWVAAETFNAASGTTSWSIPAATMANLDWPNGNYIIKAYATDDMRGVPSSISFTVFNAQVVAPAFDEVAKDTYTVKVGTIELANGAAIQRVRADVVRPYDGAVMGGVDLVKNSESNLYEGALNTLAIPSDVYTLVVTAYGQDYEGRAFSDFVIGNDSLLPSEPASVNPENPEEFLLGGKPFRYSGGNNYHLTMKPFDSKASDTTSVIWLGDEPVITLVPTGTRWRFEEQIDRVFMEMKKTNMRVLRIWFYSQGTENPSTSINRTGGGGDANYRVRYFYNGQIVYNDVTLSRMDYILYSAEKHGIMLQPTLSNYWNDYGGIQTNMNYVKSAYPNDPAAQARVNEAGTGTTAPQNAFFVSEGAWETYKNFIDTFIVRSDAVGKPWIGHPAIFAWDLMNEPRYGLDQDNSYDGLFWEGDDIRAKNWFFDYNEATGEWTWNTKGRNPPNLDPTSSKFESFKNPDKFAIPQTERTLYKWIDRASSYLKSVDPKHMVVAGTEGQTQYNPDAPYVTCNATGEKVQMAWAGWTSQGFGGDPLGTTAAPNIDMVSIHPYTQDQWAQTGATNDTYYTRANSGTAAGRYTTSQIASVLREFNKRAKELGRPLINGELGIGRNSIFGLMENGYMPPTAVQLNSQYNLYWNAHMQTAIDGNMAATMSWQIAFRTNDDSNGYAVYQYNNSSNEIISNRRRYWQYFINAGEAITYWQYPAAPAQPAFPTPAVKLESLSLVTNTGVELIPAFNPDQGYYEVEMPFSGVTTATINAVAADGVKVEITTQSGTGITAGNTVNFAVWPNATVIDVKLYSDDASSAYRIKVKQALPKTDKDVLSFDIPVGGENSRSVIDHEKATITVYVPAGTDVTALRPTFETNGIAAIVGTAIQTSGVTNQNFTNSVDYLFMAEDGSQSIYTVTVVPRATELVINAPVSVTVKKGKTVQLDVTSNAAQLIYASGNPAIATVSQTGLVTGVKTGMTVVTVYAADDSQKFAYVVINVIA